jgi:hypothetical protein
MRKGDIHAVGSNIDRAQVRSFCPENDAMCLATADGHHNSSPALRAPAPPVPPVKEDAGAESAAGSDNSSGSSGTGGRDGKKKARSSGPSNLFIGMCGWRCNAHVCLPSRHAQAL